MSNSNSDNVIIIKFAHVTIYLSNLKIFQMKTFLSFYLEFVGLRDVKIPSIKNEIKVNLLVREHRSLH